MNQSSKERAIIITGAGRGIGRATAVQLARQGWRLALVARTESELNETARLCGDARVMVAAVDVRDSAKVADVVLRAEREFGRVEALAHCAGVAPMQSIESMNDQTWRDVIDTSLSAAFYFCRALWPIWRRQAGGTAVLVSSQAARDPFKGFAAYGAAKAAVNLFGAALSREGADFGVRVHIIAPGAVETTMLRSLFTPQQIPAASTLDAADVAAVIVQCLGGDLRHTNGEVIYVHKDA